MPPPVTGKPQSNPPQAVLFEARDVARRFGSTSVLESVSFDVPRNTVVAIVGENGAGKSTLFNVISGLVRPDAGEMRLGGRRFAPASFAEAASRGISRVFQEQALVPGLPVYENLLLGRDAQFYRAGIALRKRMLAAAQAIVEAAEIEVDVTARTGDLDFSRRQSLEIARACLAPSLVDGIEHPLILLDEPTSALDRRDEEAFFRLVARIRRRGSLLFVSHRLTEVLAISDVIHVLKDGRLVARLEAARTSEAELHALMVGRERVDKHYHEQRQKRAPQGRAVFEIRGLTRRGVYEDVSLAVRPGEVVGIGGLLDSGKSALGKGAAGLETVDAGTVGLGAARHRKPNISGFIKARHGYVPAERMAEGIIPQFDVASNVAMASGGDLLSGGCGLWRRKLERRLAAEAIERFAIRSARPQTPLAFLSGGNQQKVVLARWMARDPGFLILDNPTRGVDAGAKEEIYSAIRDLTDKGAGILLITDELLELIGLSNRILIMRRGRIVQQIEAPADAKPSELDLIVPMLPDRQRHLTESSLPQADPD